MIYKVSFPSPLPNNSSEYDEVDFDLLNELIIKKEELIAISNEDLEYEMFFNLKAEKVDSNKEKLYLVCVIKKIDGFTLKKELDIPTFVDQIAQSFYDDKIPDDCECIKEAKNYLIEQTSIELLKNNILLENGQYNCFGFILSNDNKVGTIDDIKIISNNKIEMKDYQSTIDLNNGIDLKAIININNEINYQFNINSVTKNILNIDSFEINTSNIFDNVKNLLTKKDYDNYEEYIQSRRDLIIENTYENNIDVDIDILD